MSVEFAIELAGMPIGVKAIHDQTRVFCIDYITDASPAFSVEVTRADVDAEWQLSDFDVHEHAAKVEHHDAYLETLALYRLIVEELVRYDVLLVHGSALAIDGKAILLSGASGVGKSTHARLWREHFEKRVTMINDDKPLLRIGEEGATAYGTPWDGKHRLSTNKSAPLAAVCFINQAPANAIKRVEGEAAWDLLVKQVYRPRAVEGMVRMLELVDALYAQVPVFSAACTMDDQVVSMVYAALEDVL